MSDQLKELESWAAALLANASAKELRGMNKKLSMLLRKRQQAHIAANQNPDGTPYAPRLPQKRRKNGRIKRKMFAKLSTGRHLKTQSSADGAAVHFTGGAVRIARAHQLGLTDTVNTRLGIKHKYAARELLGFGLSDDDLIADIVLSQLSK